MRPIYSMKLIQIEITYACRIRCSNCTRFVGHHRKPWFMSLDMVVRGLKSLEGYRGNIGLMGGEPALHPQFPEILKIYREMIPDRRRRELWTSGHKWNEYREIIQKTFDDDLIAYNDHSSPDGLHQPLLVAAEDIIDDRELMWTLIDNCWVQNRWSASITPKGAFFCEVAAAMDHLFDGPGGYPVEPGWWNKEPKDFADQVQRYCPRCSGAVPLERMSDKVGFDLISPGNAARLAQVRSPRYLKGKFKIYDKKYTRDDYLKQKEGWAPQNYRTFVAHSPADYKPC